MALSNTIREPRRELTETAVGITILAVPVYLDYRINAYMIEQLGPKAWPPILLGMVVVGVLMAVCTVLVILAAVAAHAIGDNICTALESRGIHLRPRQRY